MKPATRPSPSYSITVGKSAWDRVDRALFVSLWKDLAPFGKIIKSELLTLRIWKLLGKDKDGLVSFEEVVITFGLLCNSDSNKRLKLITRAHQPPGI